MTRILKRVNMVTLEVKRGNPGGKDRGSICTGELIL